MRPSSGFGASRRPRWWWPLWHWRQASIWSVKAADMSLLEFNGRLRYPSGFVLEADFTTGALVTALCGPSGSGKTSILSMIAGLRTPDAGRIQLGERTLFDSTAHKNLPPEARR